MFSPEFISYLEDSVGKGNAEKAVQALSESPSVSIRMNPSKLRECPFDGASAVPWSPFGYFLKERPVFTMDPLFHAGCYYVQDSSAMMVGEVFRRALPPEGFSKVLDLCAAPGGKTTDLASSLRALAGDDFSLTANEPIRSRFNVLRSNVRVWGDPRVGVTSLDPSVYGRSGESYDVIVADVPCSGEGMFRKESKAVEQWSPENVEFCVKRQRRILEEVWPALRPGGIMVYSTCTFNRFENDGNVKWASEVLGASVVTPHLPYDCLVRTDCGYLMLPGIAPGEGQYVAVLRKNGNGTAEMGSIRAEYPAGTGFPAGTGWPMVELDLETARRYLHGDAIAIPEAPLGMVTLCYRGFPLGPGKNLGKRCNNLYPKELRIRKDI